MITLPKGVDLNSLLLFLKDIGLQSSSILRTFDNGSIPLYESEDNNISMQNIDDPVTAADLTIDKLLIDKFSEYYPDTDWGIVTEENSKNFLAQDSKSDWVWMIDPLDGTKDFIQKTGEYAVHLALLFKKNTILGVVLLPNIKEIWFGVDGLGTWKENEKGTKFNINFNYCSKAEDLRIVTSKNHSNQKLEVILKELNYKNTIRMGSIGYKICSLLRNEADIYISISDKTSPKDWDIAAPQAIMNSARCNFTYVSGEEINYDRNDYLQQGCLVASTLTKEEHLNQCKKINMIIKNFDI